MAVALGVLAAGCAADVSTEAGRAVATPSSPSLTAPATTTTAAVPERAAVPTHVRVERVGIDAEVIRLDILPSGELDVPQDYAQAGWWRDGPEPGERGPAVIAAHVDSAKDGPAAFYRLRDVAVGDQIEVDRADGTTVTFEVQRVERYPKSEFPTTTVYRETAGPELRLITCGGQFDRSARSYTDNIVAYARLATA